MRPALGPCKAHGPAGVRPATSARIATMQAGFNGWRPARESPKAMEPKPPVPVSSTSADYRRIKSEMSKPFFRLHLLDRRRWNNFCILPFDLAELLRADETNVPPRLLRQQNPRDLFHIAPTRDSLVVVGIALTHRKRHQWVVRQPPAVNLLLRCAKSLYDMRPAACYTQRLSTFRSPTLDLDRNHDVLFSKKCISASLSARGV